MYKSVGKWPFAAWQRRQHTAWGSLLDGQEILLAALSLQQAGGVRVMVFDRLRAPPDLDDAAARDAWLVDSLRQSGAQLPARLRTMALALREGRCRQGTLHWPGPPDGQALAAEVQLEASAALGVAPDQVGFDFQLSPSDGLFDAVEGTTVHWAACLRSDLAQWQGHARQAGWRLPVVEPEHQAARRAVNCLRGERLAQWATSPQDWQFSLRAEREVGDPDWQQLQASPMWGPLVACGAALGALQ